MDEVFGELTFKFVESRYGRMLSYHFPEYHEQHALVRVHPEVVNIIESKQYEVLIDIGAYIGLFTIVGAFNCKKVFAYEASPFLFGVLLYNTKFLKNVKCNYKWVGNYNSVPKTNDQLYMSRKLDSKEYNIPVVELDREFPHFDRESVLIKMDIEGSEYDALKSATSLINNIDVHWIIEVHEIMGLGIKDILPYFEGRDIRMIGDNFMYIRGLKT